MLVLKRVLEIQILIPALADYVAYLRAQAEVQPKLDELASKLTDATQRAANATELIRGLVTNPKTKE